MNQNKNGEVIDPIPLVLLGQVAGRRGAAIPPRLEAQHTGSPSSSAGLFSPSSSIPRRRKWQRLPPRLFSFFLFLPTNKNKAAAVEGQRKQPHAILGDAAPPTNLSEPRAGHCSSVVTACPLNSTSLFFSSPPAREAPPISSIYPRCRSVLLLLCSWIARLLQSPLYRPAGGVVGFLICII
ncbi:hypothetical protein BDA96_03G476200 [Sorghum bicolor]|uniref:Uncharacterized protein n=1 Tax=Sorghum bicolor TaxID=4558 RepID=A0A921RKP2_SORBI|nr:hypothetical protein BDA96_03G476200 [Sorghum bicolor]